MSILDFSTSQGVHPWAAKAFVAAIALTVLAYGSAGKAPLNLAVIAFALLAVISLSYPIRTLAVGRVHATTILIFAALLLYVLLQAVPFAAGEFISGAWKSVNDLIGPSQGTISVAPGMTLDALPTLALPFLVFLSGLALFQGDAEALRLWRSLAYFGAGYAAFGIVQDLFLPEQLFFTQKKFYLDSLTASFVNRNTAGTFFGVAFLMNLGLAFHSLRKVHIDSFLKKAMALDIGWRDKNALVLIHMFFCLVTAVALFLTQSRGAVGASFVGAVVGVILMATRRLTADKATAEPRKSRSYPTIFAGVLVILGLFALLAGKAINRMETQGTDDGRWCSFASTIEAIGDQPILGTGFGAFQDVFPAYRNAECSGIFGVWERAHNFFLEGYLGLGLLFAVALLVCYAILVGVFVHGLRSRHQFRFIPVMGLAALILASLHSIVDFSLQIPGFAAYFAAVMASTTTISLGASKE